MQLRVGEVGGQCKLTSSPSCELKNRRADMSRYILHNVCGSNFIKCPQKIQWRVPLFWMQVLRVSWLTRVRVERNASSGFKLGVFQLICWRPTLLPKQITCTLHHILSQPLSPEWLSHIDNQHVDLTNYESQQVIWVWQDCICSIDFWSQTFESWHEVWSTSQLIQANNHWQWLICETTNQSTLFYLIFRMGKSGTKYNCESKCVHNDI